MTLGDEPARSLRRRRPGRRAYQCCHHPPRAPSHARRTSMDKDLPSSATRPETTTEYVPHRLHADDRTWPLSGGHVDVWVEVLHAQRLEPSAGLAFTLALDYEGDQF